MRRTAMVMPAILFLLLLPGLAHAQDAAAPPPLSPQKIFTLLFLMLGPIKILAPFAQMTRGADATFRFRLATRAILFSAAALLLAGLIGQNMLENFNIPIPVLALTGGLVLFLVALQTVLEQFGGPARKPADAPPPTLALAINPLAFPTIVTPYGIAAMIIFTTLAQNDPEQKLVIGSLVLAILVMDWVAMLFAHVILKYIGTTLQVFAVVLGINQIALGLLVILQSLSRLGLFTLQIH
jgi:multiple antibiotic resistance protein